jgi:hypothetical protein
MNLFIFIPSQLQPMRSELYRRYNSVCLQTVICQIVGLDMYKRFESLATNIANGLGRAVMLHCTTSLTRVQTPGRARSTKPSI